MVAHADYHQSGPKLLLNGVTIPGGSAEADLDAAIDSAFTRPNTGPFVCRQLIQRLVTSNPSAAYVQRVSAEWIASNGNLGRVVRTILLDTEARLPPTAATFGKAREPLLKVTTLWRAFGARYVPPATGEIRFTFANAGDLTSSLLQDSQRAPSVFNFFEPDYRLPAADGATGPYAPEFQILTEATYASMLNQHDALVWNTTGAPPTATTPAPILDIAALKTLADAGNHAGMVQQVNTLLFSGALGNASQQEMVRMLDRLAGINESAANRAKSLVLVALASPEFAIQR